MKTHILFIATAGFLLSSCEKRQFDFVSSHVESGIYNVEETGSFNETATINLGETLNAIDVPENADVESVHIKSISIKGTALAGNEATGINLQGTLTYHGETVNLFNSNVIPIVNNAIPEIGINNLNPAAITLIKNFFTAGIYTYLGIPLGGGFDFTDNFFTVEVSGSGTPGANTPIHMRFEVNVAFDLSYSACLDALMFTGDDCL